MDISNFDSTATVVACVVVSQKSLMSVLVYGWIWCRLLFSGEWRLEGIWHRVLGSGCFDFFPRRWLRFQGSSFHRSRINWTDWGRVNSYPVYSSKSPRSLEIYRLSYWEPFQTISILLRMIHSAIQFNVLCPTAESVQKRSYIGISCVTVTREDASRQILWVYCPVAAV